MTIQPTRYARKRFFVDAIEVTAQNISDVAKWCQGEVRTEEHQVGFKDRTTVVYKYIKVRVHRPANDRQTKAFIGDFVLYAGTGYKVYSARAFENSFDPAENSVENSIYPNGKCNQCGFGLTQNKVCKNPDCSNQDVLAIFVEP